jgi:hypothetical protein
MKQPLQLLIRLYPDASATEIGWRQPLMVSSPIAAAGERCEANYKGNFFQSRLNLFSPVVKAGLRHGAFQKPENANDP